MGWALTDWDGNTRTFEKRALVTLDAQSETMSNFAALLTGANMPADLWASAQSDGRDVRLFTAAGAVVHSDLITFTPGSSTMQVRADTTLGTGETTYYLYWSSADAVMPSAAWQRATYASSLKLSLTADEASGVLYDRTANGNNFSPVGGPTYGQTGAVGAAVLLDGSDDRFDCNGTGHESLDVTNAFTFTIWMRVLNTTKDSYAYIRTESDPVPPQHAIITGYVNGVAELYTWGQSGDDPRTASRISIPDTSSYHQYAWCYDGAHLNTYLDGAPVNSTALSFSLGVPTSPVTSFGAAGSAGANVNAALDELRIANVCRSAAWIAAMRSNEYDPASFYTVGPVETAGGGVPLALLQSGQVRFL